MADGLDALDAKRQRRAVGRRAGLPSSRNHPATTQISVRQEEPSPSDVAPPARPDSPPTATTPVDLGTSAAQLVKTTIHLNAGDDQFLDEVSFAGRRARPKIDASRSAVTRLALRRLAEQMTLDEIVNELRQSAPIPTGPGRRRLA